MSSFFLAIAARRQVQIEIHIWQSTAFSHVP